MILLRSSEGATISWPSTSSEISISALGTLVAALLSTSSLNFWMMPFPWNVSLSISPMEGKNYLWPRSEGSAGTSHSRACFVSQGERESCCFTKHLTFWILSTWLYGKAAEQSPLFGSHPFVQCLVSSEGLLWFCLCCRFEPNRLFGPHGPWGFRFRSCQRCFLRVSW